MAQSGSERKAESSKCVCAVYVGMRKAFGLCKARFDRKSKVVINESQIFMYQTDDVDKAVYAYDCKTKKYVAGYAVDDMEDRQRYILYAPEYADYKHYFEKYTEKLVKQMNADNIALLPVMCVTIELVFSAVYFEWLLANGMLPELLKEENQYDCISL